jgi:LmbE family N-acetylglucosaminyl deacetylase
MPQGHRSAKGADARRQAGEELASPLGDAPSAKPVGGVVRDSTWAVPVLRELLRNKLVRTGPLLVLAALSALGIWAASEGARTPEQLAQINPNSMSIDVDRGAAGLTRLLAEIRTRASILMVTAHPDDEDGGMLAYETRRHGARGTLLTLNRGEGGQNAMSVELYDQLGLVRTQELLAADRYYGVDQYWTRAIDYGFSKTREEALQQWGFDRVLSDVVRVVRMTRPLVLTSVFAGAPTDGHGNHQVAGQMAQEAFAAAGDPNRFPEQIREGLRPWSPLKVYARVPNFLRTQNQKIYDYATDKYVPLRFYDYVNRQWMSQTPSTNLEIAEGNLDAAAGLTYQQIGRTGWGHQKSQNGGGTVPQPSLFKSPYHRYGSRIPAQDHESSFYEGIDISLAGIATLAKGDVESLRQGLAKLSRTAEEASARYRPSEPASIAPVLADGLAQVRSLVKEVAASSLADPGKSDVIFELEAKERQLQKALVLALGVSFDVAVAPERDPTGPFAAFAGAQPTFAIAIPGQSFRVQARLLSEAPDPINVESLNVAPTDGKDWAIHAEASPAASLTNAKDLSLKFAVTAPKDAVLTKPYFFRPNQEQPYYDLTDERFRNLSVAAYPLAATARLNYRGQEVTLDQVVQTNQRIEGIGILQQPLLMGPAVSITVSPGAGAIPLTSTSFDFTCSLHSNVKGPAKGILRLQLPDGWQSTPPTQEFSFNRDGEDENVSFKISPKVIQQKSYDIQAIAEYQGQKFTEGYHLVGYPGLRPYPYYRSATYRAVGVDVKTAPGLHVGYLPGTGDDVPRALQDLGLQVQILSAADLQNSDLSQFDGIVLGTRAYAVRPELRAANSRLLQYVKNGGVLIVQYNLQNFEGDYGPYPFTLGNNPQKVVDENSAVKLIKTENPVFTWPNKITEEDFKGWEEERGHGFMQKWDPHYEALIETHDPDQDPQQGGLLLAHYGKGIYVYDAFALYRQLPSGVPGAYRILANLVSMSKNPQWK